MKEEFSLAFEEGMRNLKKNNLDKAIIEYAQSGKALLGICLGMQLLMEKRDIW